MKSSVSETSAIENEKGTVKLSKYRILQEEVIVRYTPSLFGFLVVTIIFGCSETSSTKPDNMATSASEQGTITEAVQKRWKEYCASGYCEGYDGKIVAQKDDYIKVNINGNIRYLEYRIEGEPGNYTVYMWQTPNRGRDLPK